MVGILVSFWDGLFAGAMLFSGSVHPEVKRKRELTPQKLLDAWTQLIVFPVPTGLDPQEFHADPKTQN